MSTTEIAMLSDVRRGSVRSLLEEFAGQDSIPYARIEKLIRVDPPRKEYSKTGRYVVMHYDSYDHDWIVAKDPCSWEEALAYWEEETKNGLEYACYADGAYYTIRAERK